MSAGDDIEGFSTERLEHEIGELGAHINAATCRWLSMVAEFDHREGWKSWGCRSCAAWLSLRCGLAASAGREHVRVAHKLVALPLARAEFARGRLSYSKVRAISRVASEETEGELVELALEATAAQLERIVRAYRGALSADLDGANHAYEDRHVTCTWDDDGSLIVRGRLPAEDGAVLLRALGAAEDEAREEAAGASAEARAPSDAPSAPQRRADALAFVAERSLAAGSVDRSGGERHEVVVHADAAVLAGRAAEGRCELEQGPAVPAETARRLACDAGVVGIAEHDGRPLTVGRRTRTVPSALRRALRSRDEGCRFPGCNCTRRVDAHHIEHWAHGGETKLSNLVLLCRRHHRLLHEGGFGVHSEAGRLVFTRPDGRRVSAAPPPRTRGDHRALAAAHARRSLRIGPETAMARSAGGSYDLGMAVGAVLQAGGLLAPKVDPRRLAAERVAAGLIAAPEPAAEGEAEPAAA
jgi:hypothetical protein